jgi:hypothetical protein
LEVAVARLVPGTPRTRAPRGGAGDEFRPTMRSN